MSRYGITPSVGHSECLESKKDVKTRLKKAKRKLKDFMEISKNTDIGYDHRQSMVGALYMDLVSAKEQYKRIKGGK